MELEFLGLDRFEMAARSPDPAEEDAFCAKMRLLGPRWRSSMHAYNKTEWEDFERQQGSRWRQERLRFIGVASQGGVWVLETNAEDCLDRQLGRIKNARNMEEKCREIERFGGTFYADPAECLLLDLNFFFHERANTHVLVVEDNPVNRRIAQKLIEKFGFSQVTAVEDGKEALDYLLAASDGGPQRKPDMILMDMDMPVMDGFECTRNLRHESPYKDYARIPIIGSAPLNARERCIAAGMDDFIPRPLRMRDLERMLVRWSIRGRSEFSPRSEKHKQETDAGRDASAENTDSEAVQNKDILHHSIEDFILVPNDVASSRAESTQN